MDSVLALFSHHELFLPFKVFVTFARGSYVAYIYCLMGHNVNQGQHVMLYSQDVVLFLKILYGVSPVSQYN